MLEAEGITIGAVTGVQGISWQELTVTGQSNHAGTTPMDQRHDAGYVAAALAVEVRRMALDMGGHQVGTVGRMHLHPDLVNVVPVSARFTVDLRNTDEAALQEAERRLAARAEELAAAEGVTVDRTVLARFEPVEFDPRVVDLVEAHRASASATRCGACRRAPATTPRCWPGSARPGWCSCPAVAASATTRPSTPIRPTWPPAPTSCSTSCSTWPTDTSTADRRRSGRDPDAARRRGAAGAGPARPHPQGGGRAAASTCSTRPTRAGCELVVFPELALTTFFPRWFVDDITEVDDWYERAMPGPETQPLFDEAGRLGVGFCLGYAELDPATGHHYNTQILVERDGRVVARYRKVHIPGHEHARAGPAVPARRALLLRAGPRRASACGGPSAASSG